MHGLYRSLIYNMVQGVPEGYVIQTGTWSVSDTGLKPRVKFLNLALAILTTFIFGIPAEVKVETVTERRSNPVITLTSANKQLIGQVAAKIRSFRPPEPYKGKGIRFVGEDVRRKAGKSASV